MRSKIYHVRNFLKGLFLLLTFNVNSFADKVKLERPYELNPKEFSILKNQLYSCVDENKIFDDKFEGLEIQAYFFISQMRNVYWPEIINQSDSEVFFDNDGITIGNSTVKIANKIILDVFDNPDCQNLILILKKYKIFIRKNKIPALSS